MEYLRPLKPPEITEFAIETYRVKANFNLKKLILLGFLAGAFIAFAAEGSNMAAFNLLAKPETFGLGRVLAGSIFGTGLMLVVLAGGELFTGNTMMLAAVCDKKVTFRMMLRNWGFVYLGNLLGSLFIAYMIVYSGLLSSGDGMLGAITVKIALNKVNLTFIQAVYLGIMCNWLVCLAVWLSYAAESMVGKILAIFFPIWLFITSGFEHSVANMYYIPAGIMAKNLNENYGQLVNLSGQDLEALNWAGFFVNNLIPVTIGNIIGGGLLVAIIYWYAYKRA